MGRKGNVYSEGTKEMGREERNKKRRWRRTRGKRKGRQKGIIEVTRRKKEKMK